MIGSASGVSKYVFLNMCIVSSSLIRRACRFRSCNVVGRLYLTCTPYVLFGLPPYWLHASKFTLCFYFAWRPCAKLARRVFMCTAPPGCIVGGGSVHILAFVIEAGLPFWNCVENRVFHSSEECVAHAFRTFVPFVNMSQWTRDASCDVTTMIHHPQLCGRSLPIFW